MSLGSVFLGITAAAAGGVALLVFSGRSGDRSYTEEEAAKIAVDENNVHVTILLTSDGRLYSSTPDEHAEVKMIKSGKAKYITTMWIKNSPCAACSQKLSRFFQECSAKPTIYIGGIWHPYDESDRRGLVQLLLEGFNIEVWRTLHDMMYSAKSSTTTNYLEAIKNEAEQEKNRLRMYNQQQENNCSVM